MWIASCWGESFLKLWKEAEETLEAICIIYRDMLYTYWERALLLSKAVTSCFWPCRTRAAVLWNSSIEQAVSSARLRIANAWISWTEKQNKALLLFLTQRKWRTDSRILEDSRSWKQQRQWLPFNKPPLLPQQWCHFIVGLITAETEAPLKSGVFMWLSLGQKI